MNKMLLTVFALLAAAPVFADVPALLGSFQGTLFTGSTQTQEFSFRPGSYSGCTALVRESSKTYKCQASGEIVIGSPDHAADRITLDKVVVLESSSLHYYYGGFRTVRIGDRDVVQRMKITVNVTPKQADRITGYVELSDLELRSGFEAYQKAVP